MYLTEMDHFSHPHRLKLMPAEAPYQCEGCKELGFGQCYQCEMCSFHLHEECARAPTNIYHKFFKKRDFKFYVETPGERERICDACGKDIQGFMYQCSRAAFDLHPCCANLKHTLVGPGNMTLALSDKVRSACLKCQSKEVSNGVKGWSYVSSCGQYCYHVSCVKDLIVEKWRRGYFGNITEFGADYLALQNIAVPRKELAVSVGRKAKKYFHKALLFIKLVVSAIFGNPTDLIVAFLEPLLSD